MKTSDHAIIEARQYVGKVEEGVNNAAWLRKLMPKGNPAGWQPKQPYCIAALLAIFFLVCDLEGKKFPIAPSASTQTFFDNAHKDGCTGDIPSVGDIVIFRKGASWQGHAGLVTEILKTDKGIPYGIQTIEFNTSGSSKADQRDGEGCYAKQRLFKDFSPGKMLPNRLWIRGYVKTSLL
jgi:hypothetical protein